MSKLYNTYLALKKQDSKTIYLFKSGIFFIALDEDACFLSNIFHFKLVNLTDTLVKCGFPCSSFNKYDNLFKSHNLQIKIIESNNTIYNLNQYNQSSSISDLLNFITSIDVNNLSVKEAYKFIEDLKNKVNNINGENK